MFLVLFPKRRSVIRRIIAFAVLAFALWAAATPAQATLITYNMTGTVTNASGNLVNVGDRIAWTLQYNPNMTPFGTQLSSQGMYAPATPVISNIVDLTIGYHFFAPAFAGGEPAAFVTLERGILPNPPGWVSTGSFSVQSGWVSSTESADSQLWLVNSAGLLPTTNLANLQLSNVPFDLRTFEYTYATYWNSPQGLTDGGFLAQVDPLGSPVSTTPEPGSLTLFVVGALGLGVRRLRPRFERTGQHC